MESLFERPRVALATLGCKVNQYESAALMEALEHIGFQAVPFTAEADCYIVNTCTVTSRTDYQSRQLIRRAIRRNPQALIVVTGCYAQTNTAELSGIPGVTLIAGNREKTSLPQVIADLWKQKSGHITESLPPWIYRSPYPANEPLQVPPLQRFPGHTRAFLKIQDGCNAFCSYCIVPYARGNSRSLTPDMVLERLRALVASGYREVVLTGIHLGMYGQDFTPLGNLLDLLRQIEDLRIIERLRLSSIEPQEISGDLLRFFAEADFICPHLHIPLQSGDDEILSLMNRQYNRTFFRSIVERITASRPDTAVGLDVMVGFPGESENAFEQTCHLIEELPVAYLHVFPFSKRPGTPASTMKGQIKEEDKKKRAQHLRQLGEEKRQIFMTSFIGRPLRVLIEGRKEKQPGFLSGFSQNYLPVVVLNGHSAMINTVATVIPSELVGGMLYGEAIHE